MRQNPSPRIIFVTGTDTGVGKTLLTALLLHHLRSHGIPTLACKPFCSGPRTDARLLHEIQDQEVTLAEVNPFYFSEPVAPLVSARWHRRSISLGEVIEHIKTMAVRCLSAGCGPRRFPYGNGKSMRRPCLLVEGSGGVLVPLGEGFTFIDVVRELKCEILVVSRNRLGTINHTLLTAQALRGLVKGGAKKTGRGLKIVLMRQRKMDLSGASNAAVLRELLAPAPLLPFPFLGAGMRTATALRRAAQKHSRLLERIISTGES